MRKKKAMAKSREYYQSNRSNLVDLLPQAYHRVLEVGCAEGCFSSNLDPEAEIWGVEMDSCAAEIAKKRMKKVVRGAYMDVADQLPDDYFDLVICNDVIEHMPDADGFLDEIKKKMTRGAWLMGSVPNVRHYANLFFLLILKDWKYEDSGILDRTHLRFFSKKSLNRLLHDHGYRIVKFKGKHSGLKIPRTKNAFFGLIFLIILLLLSLGFWWDIQYLNFGFLCQIDDREMLYSQEH